MNLPKMPEKLTVPDWSAVMKVAQDYLDFLASPEEYYEDGHGNYEHEIYERVLEAIYGEGVFATFVNPVCDAQGERIYGKKA